MEASGKRCSEGQPGVVGRRVGGETGLVGTRPRGELIERVARFFAQHWYLYCSTEYCQPGHNESDRSRVAVAGINAEAKKKKKGQSRQVRAR